MTIFGFTIIKASKLEALIARNTDLKDVLELKAKEIELLKHAKTIISHAYHVQSNDWGGTYYVEEFDSWPSIHQNGTDGSVESDRSIYEPPMEDEHDSEERARAVAHCKEICDLLNKYRQ